MTLPDSVRAQLAHRDYAVNNKCTCMCASHNTHTDQLFLYIRLWIILQYGLKEKAGASLRAPHKPTHLIA